MQPEIFKHFASIEKKGCKQGARRKGKQVTYQTVQANLLALR